VAGGSEHRAASGRRRHEVPRADAGPAAVGQIVELDSSELHKALQDALAAYPVEVPLVWGRRFGIELNREVTFGSLGHVLFSLATGSSSLLAAAEEMCADLAGIASTHCEWAALLERGLAHDFYDGYRHARGTRLSDYYYRFGHNEDTDYFADAFAWQMVGPHQITKATDLVRWNVEPLGDLTLIRKPRLIDWVALDDSDPTRLKVDPDQLAQARQDFGAMIMTRRHQRQPPTARICREQCVLPPPMGYLLPLVPRHRSHV
jgi:hypothetical protein